MDFLKGFSWCNKVYYNNYIELLEITTKYKQQIYRHCEH